VSDKRWYLLILDRANDLEREAIQEIVRVHADEWWHELADVWVIRGHPPAYWIKLMKPIIPRGKSGILLLPLPEDVAEGELSYFGPGYQEKLAWLDEIFPSRRGTP
jgi:hypothetical protein